MDSGSGNCLLCRRGIFLLLALVVCASTAWAQQSGAPLRYRFAIGDVAHEQATGTVWLYSISSYGLMNVKLADIVNGVAEIPTDTDRIRRDLDPHPNTESYVVVLEFPGNTWFQSPKVLPDGIWANMIATLNSLGTASHLPTGEVQVVLPAPVKHRITLLHEDGRPLANTRVSALIFLIYAGHCGVPEGLPLGDKLTDATGTIEVTAPLVPLYLGIPFFENKGQGPAGAAYESHGGVKLEPEPTVVTLRKAWNDDLRWGEFVLQAVNSAGVPVSGLQIFYNERTVECSGFGTIGTTDSVGKAQLRLIPQTVESLAFTQGPGLGLQRPLSEDELRKLFTSHKLTVTIQ